MSRLTNRTGIVAGLAALAMSIALGCGRASAANFVKADVTTLLGPVFFVDDALVGGTDATINQPSSGNYVRTFGSQLTANQGTTELRITGLGFATSSSAAANDATSLTVSFTYLGADGAVGGGDDVAIGSAAGSYAYAVSGEYACVFDAPLVATLNITALKFQVSVTPTNAGGNGSVLFKVAAIPFDGITSAKLSVAGTVSGALPAIPLRVNLAKYQPTTASSVSSQLYAAGATDGVVGNTNRWTTTNVNTAHWAEVTFPVPVTIRSAHVYTGTDDGSVPGSFKVQYLSGASWVDAPGSALTGNTPSQVNVIVTSSVTSDSFRLYSDVDGFFRVKEFALFPPNPALGSGSGTEQGYPLGTDVEVNLGKKRPAVASTASGIHFPKLAVDGFVSSASKWQTSTAGTATLDIDLRVASKIGSAHLYSIDGSMLPLADFNLQYWDGTTWVAIPGGAITGNTSAARVITFSSTPITSLVRLTFTNPSVSAVRELCIFPANGGAGYSLGQDVLGVSPTTTEFGDYHDAFYNVQNRAASLPLSVNGTTPILNLATLEANLSHYQVLLNVGTDTYRLYNRSTGKCLAGAGFSTSNGASLVDQDYTAMPHQNWRLVAVDATDFYLRNEWSGLVVDTQSGGVAEGTALEQQAISGSTTQHWRFIVQTHFPKKGQAGYLANVAEMKGNWGYNWGRSTTVTLQAGFVYNPMQWGNFNWDLGSGQGPLEQFLSEWRRQDQGMYLLGFNEPDQAGQANMTVEQAITLWPRLERMDMPLVAPVPANTESAWMVDFMAEAQARGYRMDVIANHHYANADGGNPDGMISRLQNLNTTYGRPVWLTEFGIVDWNGTGNWTEEDNYNWLAEFMWRAESLPWLQRHSLFIFTASTTSPEPANTTDTVAPRSNSYQADGVTPTAFGELYFAWDGDATVRGDKPYFIHNKGKRKRLRNAVGSTAPGHRNIRDGGDTVQWVLRPSGTAGQWHLVPLRDGRLLRYTGSALNFAPAHTTGSTVRWSLVAEQDGWSYLENPAATAANRRLKFDNGTFSMVNNTSTIDENKWRFIVPFAPGEAAAPEAIANVSATAGNAQVTLAWTPSANPDLSFYSVYRSNTSGGPYTLVASNLTTASYTNNALQNGTGYYYYTVTATDLTGYESTLSTQSAATPVISTPPMSLGTSLSNGTFTITWPATHLGWILESQASGLSAKTGSPCPIQRRPPSTHRRSHPEHPRSFSDSGAPNSISGNTWFMPRHPCDLIVALLMSIYVLFAVEEALGNQANAANPSKPNIIVILADDVGWGDLGCYGATQIKTPNLDGLAREGMRFTDAHASASVCTPTRYSMLTGQYSWRRDAPGLNKGVSNGDSPLLIPVGSSTLPGLLKGAGYCTGAVGKWHLGFGNTAPDYNQELSPGPLEIGFDEFFGYPATNDRVPTVYVRDHRVVGLDPADPITISYKQPTDPALSRMAAGRQRIGWMSGGKGAFWKDTQMADTLTGEAVAFIARGKAQPFFLYFAPHNCHAPVVPGPRFAGGSGLSARADAIQELDWSVGEILKTLDRLDLAKNTLVVFSSDNGAYVTDEKGHRPNGPYRGEKSQLWEGGHREPFLARWPGRIKPGVSDALICLVDLPATAAAIAGVKLAADAAPDSFNLLPLLLGEKNPHPRENLIVMSGTGALAVRQGPWKYIPNLAAANGWQAGKPNASASRTGPGLYNVMDDPGETKNIVNDQPETAQRLVEALRKARDARLTRPD